MAVSNYFVTNVENNYAPDPSDNVFSSLFGQYEKVIFQSLITSFGLDALIKDRVGGDVDTIHNVYKSKVLERHKQSGGVRG